MAEGGFARVGAGEAGSTLIEVLVASAVIAVGALAMARAFTEGAAAGLTARSRTVATILASQKVEEVRALALDAVLDTSPANALADDAPGFVEHLDADGRVLATGVPPPESVYTRRWSVTPLAGPPGQSVLLQVVVVRRGSGSAGVAGRLPGEARLATIIGRRGP